MMAHCFAAEHLHVHAMLQHHGLTITLNFKILVLAGFSGFCLVFVETPPTGVAFLFLAGLAVFSGFWLL